MEKKKLIHSAIVVCIGRSSFEQVAGARVDKGVCVSSQDTHDVPARVV